MKTVHRGTDAVVYIVVVVVAGGILLTLVSTRFVLAAIGTVAADSVRTGAPLTHSSVKRHRVYFLTIPRKIQQNSPVIPHKSRGKLIRGGGPS